MANLRKKCNTNTFILPPQQNSEEKNTNNMVKKIITNRLPVKEWLGASGVGLDS